MRRLVAERNSAMPRLPRFRPRFMEGRVRPVRGTMRPVPWQMFLQHAKARLDREVRAGVRAE